LLRLLRLLDPVGYQDTASHGQVADCGEDVAALIETWDTLVREALPTAAGASRSRNCRLSSPSVTLRIRTAPGWPSRQGNGARLSPGWRPGSSAWA